MNRPTNVVGVALATLLAIGIAVLLATVMTQPREPVSVNGSVYVTAYGHVRKQPDLNADLGPEVQKGQKLTYSQIKNGWYSVSVAGDSGTYFIQSREISVFAPDTSTAVQRLETARNASAGTASGTGVAPLHSAGWSWYQEYDFVTAEGAVKNTSGRTLRYVRAVVTFTTTDGTFITSDDTYVKFTTLMPGQTSPWKLMTTFNPMMKKAHLEFMDASGERLECTEGK